MLQSRDAQGGKPLLHGTGALGSPAGAGGAPALLPLDAGVFPGPGDVQIVKQAGEDAPGRLSSAPLSPQLQLSSCQPGAPGAGGDGRRSLGCCFNNLYFHSPLIGASPGRGCSSLLGQGGLREAHPNADFSFSVGIKKLLLPLFRVAGCWCMMRAVFLQRSEG